MLLPSFFSLCTLAISMYCSQLFGGGVWPVFNLIWYLLLWQQHLIYITNTILQSQWLCYIKHYLHYSLHGYMCIQCIQCTCKLTCFSIVEFLPLSIQALCVCVCMSVCVCMCMSVSVVTTGVIDYHYNYFKGTQLQFQLPTTPQW